MALRQWTSFLRYELQLSEESQESFCGYSCSSSVDRFIFPSTKNPNLSQYQIQPGYMYYIYIYIFRSEDFPLMQYFIIFILLASLYSSFFLFLFYTSSTNQEGIRMGVKEYRLQTFVGNFFFFQLKNTGTLGYGQVHFLYSFLISWPNYQQKLSCRERSPKTNVAYLFSFCRAWPMQNMKTKLRPHRLC